MPFRIVTVTGERPSFLRMLYRLLLRFGGPNHLLIDFYWLTGDDYRQTLTDKLAGTLVVRRSATPAGSGEITLNRYTMNCFCFVFYEVRRPQEKPV